MTQLNPNWIQASTYSARLDRQVIKATLSEGVLTDSKVTQDSGANMNVRISLGTGVIYGDDQADQGAYLVTETVTETITLSAAPGSNSRRDLIYWRINDPNAGGPAGSNSAFGKVDGTPAASPTLPALPTSAIPLAEVLVTAGNVAVVNSMITSLRVPAYAFGALPPGVPFPFFGPESAIPADCVLYRGQAISRDTYWRIFYYLGTTHGTGDGSTTFNVPDMRGRAPFGLDNMGGTDAGVLTSANTLGLKLGAELHTLVAAEIPVHSHTVDPPNTAVSITDPGHVHGSRQFVASSSYTMTNSLPGDVPTATSPVATGITASVDIALFNSGNYGSGAAHNNMPPAIMCNWIARN